MFVWLQTSHFLYHLIFWNGYVTGMYQRELFQLNTYVFCDVGQYSWDASVFIFDENIALGIYYNILSWKLFSQIKPWPFAIKRLLNKPYENKVTLRE